MLLITLWLGSVLVKSYEWDRGLGAARTHARSTKRKNPNLTVTIADNTGTIVDRF